MRKPIKILIVTAVLAAVFLAVFLPVYFLKIRPDRQRKVRLALFQAYYDTKVASYEEENKGIEAGEIDVVFLGDSLTDGCDLARYYPDYRSLNRGIGGDTTTGLLKRMKVSVYDVKPKVAVVLIGGNNLKTMFDDYEEILKGLQGNIPDTKVVLVSLTSMSEKNEIAALNNVRIKLLAEHYGYEYADVFSALFDEGSMAIRGEYTSDGAHLTDAGYQVLSAVITAAIERALAA